LSATTVAAAVDEAVTDFDTGPYKFFDYFGDVEHDRGTFAGRDDDVAEVVARTTRHQTLVLYGRSGLGKTSLLLAGVFPQLRERGFEPIAVRTLEDPLLDIRNAVARRLGLPEGRNPSDLGALVGALGNTAAAGVVLVCDQFEEFFTRQRHKPAERRSSVQELARLIKDPTLSLHIVFSLREDFLAEMDEFRTVVPDILGNTYRLLPLSAFGARQAIVTPLHAASIEFDPRLVARLVDLLAPEFDPLLLQIACTEVYREARRRGDGAATKLTEADLDALGGLEGLFGRYLALTIRNLQAGQLILGRAILDALISVEDTKRALTVEELTAHEAFSASADEVLAVLGCFRAHRLVRHDRRADKDWYELSHDRLVKSILDWFRDDQDFAGFRAARNLIATAARNDGYRQRLELLLAGDQIEEFVDKYRSRLRLSEKERELMVWSAIYRGTKRAEYWIELFGRERSMPILLSLMRHASDAARLGAVAAAAQLKDAPGLAQACVAAAICDRSSEVRLAAGRALTHIGGPAEVSTIKVALATRATRHHAIDLLAELRGTLIYAEMPRFWRLHASWRWRQAAFSRARDQVHKRTVRGAIAGLLAALTWTMTSALILVSAFVWTAGWSPWTVETVRWLTWAGGAALLTAPTLGAYLARQAARRAAMCGQEADWIRTMLRVWWPIALAAGVGLLWVALEVGMPDAFDAAKNVLPVLAVPPVAVVYISLFRRTVWPATRTRDVLLWSVLVGFGVPICAGLVALARPSAVDDGSALNWLLLTALMSLLATLMLLVMADHPRAERLGASVRLRPALRMRLRVITVAFALTVPVFYVAWFGKDSVPLPLIQRTYTVGGAPVPISLALARRDSAYFRLRSDVGADWAEITDAPSGVSVMLGSTDIVEAADHSTAPQDRLSTILFVPSNGVTLVARRSKADLQSNRTATPLSFSSIPEFPDDGAVPVGRDRWIPRIARLRLQRTSDRGERIWHGTARVRVPADAAKESALGVAVAWDGGGAVGELNLSVKQSGDPKGSDREQRSIRYIAVGKGKVVFRFSPNIRPKNAAGEADPVELQPLTIGSDGSVTIDVTYTAPPPTSGALSPMGSAAALAATPGSITVPVLLSLVPAKGSGTELAAAQYARCVLLDQDFRYREALPLCKSATEADPQNPRYLNSYAWALLGVGETVGALAPARKAADLARPISQYLYILDTLAHAEYANHNWNKAIETWEAILSTEPDYYKAPNPACKRDLERLADARRRAVNGT
jgi:hypothetical protein